jgi:hypothetical protein
LQAVDERSTFPWQPERRLRLQRRVPCPVNFVQEGVMAMPAVRTFTTATVLLLCGCVTQHPQNAEEFRKMAPGAFMVKVETHEINRSTREIGATFRKRARCMNIG